jgi:hypothetical protein
VTTSSIRSRRSAGYSVLELTVALSIAMTILSTSVYTFLPSRRAYSVDEVAGQFQRVMREASMRALTHRQSMRVFVNGRVTPVTVPNTTPAITCPANSIAFIDENGVGTGDEAVVRTEPLTGGLSISIGRPTNLPATSHPPAPYNFSAASLGASGTWECYFQPTGRATSAAGVPLSATLYFYTEKPSAPTMAHDLSLVRALTLFGPTGTTRFWHYSPDAAVGTWAAR